VCPRALEEPVDVDPVRRTELLAAIGSLTPGQQEAVVLAFWGDMTAAEIAARAGVPLGTVKGRVRLGLSKLRRAYDERAA
jgi:RNA polymerase sigma-70 factor (ECF subfamily)